MGRSPVKTLDRMLTREKLVLSALVAFTVTQQRLHDLVLDEDDGARGSSSDDEYMGQYQRAHAAMLQQCGILCSAIEPQLRPKTRYSIGPERWSFERIERQFGNSASCEAMFRFSLPYLRQLYAALDFPAVVQTRSRNSATGEEIFLYMLRRMSYPSTLTTLAWESGRSTSAQSEMFQEGIDHIYHKFAHLRDNRSLECWARHFKGFAGAIHAGGRKGRAPLKNCVGYLDGSNQYISKPHLNQGILYNGHKRKHCVKWQGLMLPNGIMPMPYGPVHGRHHDSYMLDQSRLVRVMRRCCRHVGKTYQLYGDPAYPQSPWIGGPFRHAHLDFAESQFNAQMSSTRIANEWGFGRIKLLWAYLDFENGQKIYLNDVKKYWPVAQILTNCHACCYANQVSDYFEMKPPLLKDYVTNTV